MDLRMYFVIIREEAELLRGALWSTFIAQGALAPLHPSNMHICFL